MGESRGSITLTLLAAADSDEAELDELAGDLRKRLLELDVASVERGRADEVPAGAKGVDGATVGTLVVALSSVTLKSVVQITQAWLRNRPVRGLKLTRGEEVLELSGTSKEIQDQVVESFLRRAGED